MPEKAQISTTLQPLPVLRRLQNESRLTAVQAENYLREVRAERLAQENATRFTPGIAHGLKLKS